PERPVTDDEREHRERERGRREHRRERDQGELEVDPRHASPCSDALASRLASLRASCAAFCSAAFSFAPAYESPTSCLPPVQPNPQVISAIPKTMFQAVVTSCCATE